MRNSHFGFCSVVLCSWTGFCSATGCAITVRVQLVRMTTASTMGAIRRYLALLARVTVLDFVVVLYRMMPSPDLSVYVIHK